MIAADGRTVWLRNMVNVLVEKGRVTQVFGVSVDISDRKQAEELKSTMTRKLILAQERERRRISRELHDDINQRLALMSIDLEQLLEKQDRLPSDVRNGLISLRERAMELSSDIESLSHQLHSSKLEYVGLVKAIESFCREFGQKHGLEINFRKENISTSPSPEISLCLFRVLQEALSNAAKYSGVDTVQVELAQRSGQMHLKVCDSGLGFDLQKAGVAVGLGLTSMQERVRLVNGSMRIQSWPLAGTTIDVVVPLDDVSQELTG
jgi:signal transduction histidine kinase